MGTCPVEDHANTVIDPKVIIELKSIGRQMAFIEASSASRRWREDRDSPSSSARTTMLSEPSRIASMLHADPLGSIPLRFMGISWSPGAASSCSIIDEFT